MIKRVLAALSFRHLLLLVFLLIVLPLSGTAIHALFTLERLAEDSRESVLGAIHLTENGQRLNERTIAMERSARQFLILSDPAFQELYAEAWADARELLDSLAAALPDVPEATFSEWMEGSEAAWRILQQHGAVGQAAGSPDLNQIFGRLSAINSQLSTESKNEVERRNQRLLAELEQRQSVLAGMVIVAVLIAASLAFGFGVWLSKSMARIESAIGRLGESRFDQAIKVPGPADLRCIGHQLDWLRQRLANLESDKSRFLRHVSHELKTPLAALSEGVALLGEEVVGTLVPKQQEVVRILRHNTLSLQQQIEDLLRYNAAIFEVQQLRLAPLDLEKLLHEVIDSQQLQWQARALRVEVEGGPAMVNADRDKLTITLGNLLSNAVRFSSDGDTIRFVLSNEGGRIRLDCIDQGPGVAPADTTRIFEPFYQGAHQPPGPRRGSGIGLSIVREYIEAHRGTVQLIPRERGAHFRIELANEN